MINKISKERERWFSIYPTVIFLSVLLIACTNKKSSSSSSAPKPHTLDSAVRLDITLLPNGAAYATSVLEGTWYVRGNRAVRVVSEDSTMELPRLRNIVPALNGGAYATSYPYGGGLWFLHGGRAEKIVEVKSLLDTGTLPDNGFYLSYLEGLKKRSERLQEFVKDIASRLEEKSD